MAKIRSVKPEFWSDDKIVDLSPIAKLLYIGIWNFADDDGYIKDSVRQLQLKVFPGNPDYDVDKARDELLEANVLVLTDSDQGPLLWIPRFRDHQAPRRPVPTKFTGIQGAKALSKHDMSSPTRAQDVPRQEMSPGEERRGEEGRVIEASLLGEETPKLKETRLPKSWSPSPAHITMAKQLGVDVVAHADAFRLHAETHDRHAARWNAAFTTWLKKAPTMGRGNVIRPNPDAWMNR